MDKTILEDNWKCLVCESFNIGERNVCSQCLTKKSGTETNTPVDDKKISYLEKRNEEILNNSAEKRSEEAKIIPKKKEIDADWNCNSCKKKNRYYYKDKCVYCRASKEIEDVIESPVEVKSNRWTCENCKSSNDDSGTICCGCYILRRDPAESVKQKTIKLDSKDNWVCLSCKKSNYSVMSYCLYCHSSKATIEESSPKEESKWNCTQCFSSNRPDAKVCYVCYKCRIWACSNCSQANSATAVRCKACRTLRKITSIKSEGSYDTKSSIKQKKCRTCGHENYSSTLICEGCCRRLH